MISSWIKARVMIVCPALLFLIFGSCGSSLAQSDLASKKILFLHSFEGNAPVFLGTDRGLSTTLQSRGISSRNQFFEFLDLGRNPGPERSNLHRKIKTHSLEAKKE